MGRGAPRGMRVLSQSGAASTQPTPLPVPCDQTVEQYRKDDQRHHYVHPVALPQEGEHREGHTRHWRRNQEQQTQLDDATAMEPTRVPPDATEPPQVRRLTPEDVIVRRRRAVVEKVVHTPQEHHTGGKAYSQPQEI